MRSRSLYWIGVFAGLVAVAVSGPATTVVAGPGTWLPHSALTEARVRAASGEIESPGGSLTLPVEALHVTGLGAATLVVGYEPAVVRVTACRRNPAFDVGLCNIQYDRDGDGTPDAVRFNVVSLDGQSSVAGTPLNLITITFEAVGRAGKGSALEVEALTFTNTDGRSIAVTTENGRVDIGDGLPPISPSEVFLPLLRYD